MLFLHYGNLLSGLGLLAAPSLVRGRRGSRLTAVLVGFSPFALIGQRLLQRARLARG